VNSHQKSRGEIDGYIDTLTDAERDALGSASVALDIAGLAYRARTLRGLTQAEAAEASGLKQQAITRIEGGTINVTVRTLERYLSALGLSLALGIFDEDAGEIIDKITLNRSNNDVNTQLVSTAHHDHSAALKQ
jgi:transcriptional regulator with XRE-family HTH domain